MAKNPNPPRTHTLRFPDDLWEQAQEAVWYERKSVNMVLAEALEAWVAAAQKKHNNGKPFPIPPKKAGK